MRMPNGREFETTFWEDFTIADAFGNPAIKDTFKRAFEAWKNDLKYCTELVIVLNMKCWEWYELGDMKRSKIYSDFYHKAHHYARRHYKGADARYYFEMTD